MFAGLQRHFDFRVGFFAQFPTPNSAAVDEILASDVTSGSVDARDDRNIAGVESRVDPVQATVFKDADAFVSTGAC